MIIQTLFLKPTNKKLHSEFSWGWKSIPVYNISTVLCNSERCLVYRICGHPLTFTAHFITFAASSLFPVLVCLCENELINQFSMCLKCSQIFIMPCLAWTFNPWEPIFSGFDRAMYQLCLASLPIHEIPTYIPIEPRIQAGSSGH